MHSFVVCAFFKCSFDVGAFVKYFFVGVLLSACLCHLTVRPIMLFSDMQFWCFVFLAWLIFELLSILIFFTFSLNLICSFVDIPNFDIWQYVLVMSRTRFRVKPHSIVAWMSRNAQSRREIWSLSDYNWTRTHSQLVFV